MFCDLEALWALEWVALRASPIWWGLGVTRGHGAPVVLVPGFLGTDGDLLELYNWLQRIAYRPYMSQIGWNAECLQILTARLLHRIDQAHAETGRKVHLIGHSLGGMLARSAATLQPESVASVVTLASPFRGVRPYSLVTAAAARVRPPIRIEPPSSARPHCYTAYCGCEATAALHRTFPLDIPQMAVYTRTDGIVDWRYCLNDDPMTDVEVPGTHVGLTFNQFVYHAIATHLATAGDTPRSNSPAG
jgi:triacylglycerol lipase